MKLKNKLKWIISIFFLGFSIFAGIMHQIKGGGPDGSPSTDALCPFGGMETLYSLITTGDYIKKVEPSSLILLIAIIVLTILIGRAFCGYLCPLGTIQSIINKIAKKLNIKQIKVNENLDKILRYAKYAVLLLVLYTTYKAGELIIKPYDPWATFMHLGNGSEIFEEFLIGFVLLITIVISSAFIERAWCKYFCPLGATLAILSPLRIFKIKRNSTSCISCTACTKNCPMGLNIHSCEAVSSMECISCNECTTSCPVPKTLEMKKWNFKLSVNKTASLIIAVLVLVIGLSAITGQFKTASSTKEVLIENGQANPDNIKGYMTINDICKEFNIDKDIFLEKAKLPKNTDLNTSLKNLKTDFQEKGIEFEPDTARKVVKELIK
ncbi:4Fe-4S binding protein [Clostridium aestuarii]|uniref:4Fe-4S binding protein n=1 Tax=Clostridium aestuarii TaxID=338193 RepID=A0ABT4CVN7_9CLOT|nr:4Fe-4S binding protein [Clostridium aestuarii]MCY6483047.1 4Fe-4S binding protein [Clostridium aestuarii]